MSADRTALVIMDLQRGIIERFGWTQSVLDPVASALDGARDLGISVVFVRTGLRRTASDVPSANPIATWLYSEGDLFQEDSALTEIHETVLPNDDEPVVVKRRVSAFAGTDLDPVLRSRGISHIVLTGVATGAVVLATLLDAIDRDYAVTVLSDGCADQDPVTHEFLITSLFPGRGAQVSSAAEWRAAATSAAAAAR